MDLKAQKPAAGIMQIGEWEDAKVYRVSCICGGTDCDHTVWVEADDAGVNVTIFSDGKTNFWSKTRWHHIWTLLTKGYVEYETCVIMNQQQALNYAETLKTAVKHLTNKENINVKH